MKIKRNKKDKVKHRTERTFEKGESDYIQEQIELDLKEKRSQHKKIYGVETFESEEKSEDSIKELQDIREDEEESIDSI